MKITNVNALSGYKLQVVFDDGVSGEIDLKDFIGNGVFASLTDHTLFNKAYTTGYSIAWNDELEIDAVTVYAEILNKNPEDVISANYSYASN
jgi:hypothetical protein